MEHETGGRRSGGPRIVSVGFDPVAGEVIVERGDGAPETEIRSDGVVVKLYCGVGILITVVENERIVVTAHSVVEGDRVRLVVTDIDEQRCSISIAPTDG